MYGSELIRMLRSYWYDLRISNELYERGPVYASPYCSSSMLLFIYIQIAILVMSSYVHMRRILIHIPARIDTISHNVASSAQPIVRKAMHKLGYRERI